MVNFVYSKKWVIMPALIMTFVIFFITSFSLLPNLNNHLDSIITDINNFKVHTKTTNDVNIHNGLSAISFVIGYFGFEGLEAVSSSAFIFCAVSFYIILPILSFFIFSFLFIVFGHRYFYNQPHWKWIKYHKIFFRSSFFLFFLGLVLAFLGMLFMGIADNLSDPNSLVWGFKKDWYDLSSNENSAFLICTNIATNKELVVIPTTLNLIDIYINQFGVGYLMNINGNGAGLIKAGFVLLYIILPIITVGVISSFTMRLVVEDLLPYANVSTSKTHFNNWLKYGNISSKKEFLGRVKGNIGLLVVFAAFLFSMIFPALTNFSHNSLLVNVSSILILILGCSPLAFMLVQLSFLQNFNYNLWFFIQMIVWILLSISWQLTVWIKFETLFNFHMILQICIFFSIITADMIGMALLVFGGERYRKNAY